MYAIYGTGGAGREAARIALACTETLDRDAHRCPVVFVDDRHSAGLCVGVPVLSFDQLVSSDHRHRKVVAAVGDGATRRRLMDKCEQAGLLVATFAAPSARVYEGASVGSGAFFGEDVLVTANAEIGRGFRADMRATIAHDVRIGDYVTVSPGAMICGNVTIGNLAFIGASAVVRQGITIGADAIVGMGAVVVRNVPPGTTVMGNPARPIERSA